MKESIENTLENIKGGLIITGIIILSILIFIPVIILSGIFEKKMTEEERKEMEKRLNDDRNRIRCGCGGHGHNRPIPHYQSNIDSEYRVFNLPSKIQNGLAN